MTRRAEPKKKTGQAREDINRAWGLFNADHRMPKSMRMNMAETPAK